MGWLMKRNAYFNDYVHGKIEITGPYSEIFLDLIHTPEMKRLHEIKQLSLAHFDEPGLTHTRFSHSIGAFHVFNGMMNFVRHNMPDNTGFSEERFLTAGAAIILHDVGHGPLSHVLENVASLINEKHRTHEDWGKDIITHPGTSVNRILRSIDGTGKVAEEAGKIISGHIPADIYSSAVSSQFDSDRIDWLLRDQPSMRKFDWKKIFEFTEIANITNGDGYPRQQFVVKNDGVTEMENYLQSRYDAYQTLYQGSNKVAMEAHMKCLLFRAACVLNTVPAEKLKMNEDDALVQYLEKGGDIPLETYLELDDSSVREAIKKFAKCGNTDKKLAKMAANILEGNFYKGLDIHTVIPLHKNNYETVSDFIDKWAERSGLEKDIDYKTVRKGKPGYIHETSQKNAGNRILALSETGGEICDIYDVSPRVRTLTSAAPRCTVAVPDENIKSKLKEALTARFGKPG